MTGINSVIDIPTPSRSPSRHSSIQSLQDALSNKHSGTHSSQTQRCKTARGKRFSQKLIDAANRTSFARNPLLTPSASSSLSPPPGNYLDDDGLTDSSSCISTPQRNEYELNRNFGNLMLSPLHMDLTNHATSLTSPYTHEISSNNNTARVIGIQTRRDGKRSETRQHVADAPSLSLKPKRRKLKQQKKTSWRTGNDAMLDTTKVHEEVSENAQQNDKQQQQAENSENESRHHDYHQERRRSVRIAKQHEGMGLPGNMATKRNKKIPLILGTPGGSSQLRDAEIYTGDDINDDGAHRNTSSNSSNSSNSNNSSNQRRRQQRDRLDVVEFRLSQLLYTYDTLDLSHYSVVPQPTTPLVIIISDDDDDNDGNNNNNRSSINRNRKGKKYHDSTIRSATPGNYVDLTSPSPPSSPLLPTMTTLRDSELSTKTNAMSANTIHTLDNTQNDDALTTDETPPSSDSNVVNPVPVNTSSISSTSETNPVDLPIADNSNITTVTNGGISESTSPKASPTSGTLTTVVENPASNRHDQDTFTSSQKSSAPTETTNEKTADHAPSEQAKHMYAFLAKGGPFEKVNNTTGQQQEDDLSRSVTTNDHNQRNKENLAPITTTTCLPLSSTPSSADAHQCQVSRVTTHLQERSSSSISISTSTSTTATTTTTNDLNQSSMLNRAFDPLIPNFIGN